MMRRVAWFSADVHAATFGSVEWTDQRGAAAARAGSGGGRAQRARQHAATRRLSQRSGHRRVGTHRVQGVSQRSQQEGAGG